MQNSKRGPKGIGAKRKQPHPFPFRPEPNEKFSCKHVQGWPIVFLKIQEKNDGCHPRAGIHYYAVNRLPSRKNITVRLFSILLQVIAFESNPFLWDVTSENVTSDKWELCSFFSAWGALWTVYSAEETEKARSRWQIFREMEQQFWKYPLPQDNYSIWWSSCYHWYCTCGEQFLRYFH